MISPQPLLYAVQIRVDRTRRVRGVVKAEMTRPFMVSLSSLLVGVLQREVMDEERKKITLRKRKNIERE